jgi:hypothetical protein
MRICIATYLVALIAVTPSHVIPAIRSLSQAHPYVIVHTKQKGDKRQSTNSAIAKQTPIDARKCAGKEEGKKKKKQGPIKAELDTVRIVVFFLLFNPPPNPRMSVMRYP